MGKLSDQEKAHLARRVESAEKHRASVELKGAMGEAARRAPPTEAELVSPAAEAAGPGIGLLEVHRLLDVACGDGARAELRGANLWINDGEDDSEYLDYGEVASPDEVRALLALRFGS